MQRLLKVVKGCVFARRGGSREHAAARSAAVLKDDDVYGVSRALTLVQFAIYAEMIQHPVMVEQPAPEAHLIGGAVLFAPAVVVPLLPADDQHGASVFFQRTQSAGHNGVVNLAGRQTMNGKLPVLYAAKGGVGDNHVHAGRRVFHSVTLGNREALGAQTRGPVGVQFVDRGVPGIRLYQQHAVAGCRFEYCRVSVNARQT